MFGNVLIDKPNILIKDYETYRAYYCGVCKSIGKEYGTLLRLTLNYDIVLLALLGYNYERIEPIYLSEHCITHPLRKVPTIKNNEVLTRVADINIILGYYKATDDVLDENKHRLWKSTIATKLKKARKKLPEFDKAVKEGYEKIRTSEKEKRPAERIADLFGQIMMACADALTSKGDAKLKKLLYYVGKWVYYIDALEDIKEDFEKKRYNPFLRKDTVWSDTVFTEVEKEARPCLYDCIDRIIEVYNTMEIKFGEGALSNIVYRGFKARTEHVLDAKGEKCKKIRL